MRVEIVTVGNELLSGKVVDTNAAFLARELEDLGFERAFRTTVGDDRAWVREALRPALSRAEILVFTGGLGPTHDDLTVEAIAEYFGAPLVERPEAVAAMRERFAARGLPMPPSNLKQALLPAGAELLPNAHGTAPGMWWDVAGRPAAGTCRLILAFPGVPDEMKRMWIESVRPRLAPLSGLSVASTYVNVIGISESGMMERLADRIDRPDGTILPYANNFQIQLRALSVQADPAAARAAVDRTVAIVRERLGAHVFGTDDATLESTVGDLLKAKPATLAVAESCTGGLVSSRLTDVPGSSAYVGLNVVTYSYEAKTATLGVPAALIARHGAVSEECAVAMAEGIRRLAGADVGLALSGIAGPSGGTAEKPVGTLWVALADSEGTVAKRFLPPATTVRTAMKWRFSQYALDLLRRRLAGLPLE